MTAARAALRSHGTGLAARRDVRAVAVGTKHVDGVDSGQECVSVWVARKLPTEALTAAELIPESLVTDSGDEVATDVRQTTAVTGPPPVTVDGLVVEAPLPGVGVSELRSLIRPVIGGVSAANWRFGTGTLSVTATDNTYPGVSFALSCNHVLAGLNRYPLGDPVLQPAPTDGGTWPGAAVGQLARYLPMRFDGTANPVDAAVAYLPTGAGAGTGPAQVAWLGPVTGVRAESGISPGEPVRKVGRSTGLTSAHVMGVEALVWVDYSETRLAGKALLSHQILTTPCAAYGDSGSLLLDADGRGVGILGAGSTAMTVFSCLDVIEHELDITVAPRTE